MTLRLNSCLCVFGLYLPYDHLKGYNSFCQEGIWHIYIHICEHVYTQSPRQTIYLIHHTLVQHYDSVWWQIVQYVYAMLPPSDAQRNCMLFSVTPDLEKCLSYLRELHFLFLGR